MPRFVRRFRQRAGLLAIVACVVVVGAVSVAVVLTSGAEFSASLVAWVVSGALAIGAAVFAVSSLRRSSAIRQVAVQHPDALVFLARRQPAVISDLGNYLGGSGVATEVADKWLVAVADDRGLSAWSIGRDSRELLIMPWKDVGSIEQTRLENGRPGVAVDVKPFETPLVVSVGFSAFGIHAALDRAGVAEVVAASSAFRP
ncbi:hypothetical protein BH09ACT4_BH09ACT4_17030 [soil metagenome]